MAASQQSLPLWPGPLLRRAGLGSCSPPGQADPRVVLDAGGLPGPGSGGPGRGTPGRIFSAGPQGGQEGAYLPHRISVGPETRLPTPIPRGKRKVGLLVGEEPLDGESPARPAKPGGGPRGGGPVPPRSQPRPEEGIGAGSPQPRALGRTRLGLPSSEEAADAGPAGPTRPRPPPPRPPAPLPQRAAASEDRGCGRGHSPPERAGRAAATDPSGRRRRRRCCSPRSLVSRPRPGTSASVAASERL